MAAFIPLIAGGVSAIGHYQEGDALEAKGKQQAALEEAQGVRAEQVALGQEATQRRSAREFLGRQAAAFTESGSGPGSSTAVMNQSAINAELDALNVRYKGQLTKFGYDYNARSTLQEGEDAKRKEYQLAGTAMLNSIAKSYGSA